MQTASTMSSSTNAATRPPSPGEEAKTSLGFEPNVIAAASAESSVHSSDVKNSSSTTPGEIEIPEGQSSAVVRESGVHKSVKFVRAADGSIAAEAQRGSTSPTDDGAHPKVCPF